MAEEQVKDGWRKLPNGTTEFRVGGTVYTIPEAQPKETAADFRAMNDVLQKSRKGPIEAVLPEIEKLKDFPEAQKRLLEMAYADLKKGAAEKHVSNEDIRSWMETLPGAMFWLGRMFKRSYPSITEDELMVILTRLGPMEVVKATDEVNENAIKQILPETQPA